MRIEMTVADDAQSLVSGRPELWVRVLSNHVVDLPRAVAAFDDDQRQLFAQYNPRPVGYYPDSAEDTDYPFGDWFIFSKRGVA